MRVVSVLLKAVGAKRILEIGCGIGYSGLHLATSAGPDGGLDTIERVHNHALLARQNFQTAGVGDQVRIIEGDADHVLLTLSGHYDLVYDDGWFAREPEYLESMLDLIRPDGLLVMANWFLLEDAVTGNLREDWSKFGGNKWSEQTKAYASKLAANPRLRIAFDLPLIAVGVKLDRGAHHLFTEVSDRCDPLPRFFPGRGSRVRTSSPAPDSTAASGTLSSPSVSRG